VKGSSKNMSDLDDDDYARYYTGATRAQMPPPPPRAAAAAAAYEDPYDVAKRREDRDLEGDPERFTLRHSLRDEGSQKRQRTSSLGSAPAGSAPQEGRRRRAPEGPLVSYRVKTAARALLQANSDGVLKLSEHTRAECTRLTLGTVDEFTQEDPYVVLVDTVRAGALRLHLKEAVPLSLLLLARLLRCSYGYGREYAQAKLKPFHDASTEHAQPFRCAETVAEALEAEEDGGAHLRALVEGHVRALGPLASEAVATHHFVDEQLEVLRERRGTPA